jgi:predicted nucleic-acid-binding protein
MRGLDANILLRYVLQDETIWQTLKLYEQGYAGFADYLIGVLNHRSGASPTVTFDQKAAKESLFKLLA